MAASFLKGSPCVSRRRQIVTMARTSETLMARGLGAMWLSRMSCMLHIHTCGHICIHHGHEESVLYCVAMQHDTGPRSWQKDRIFRIQEGTGEPGRLGLGHTDEMKTSGVARSSPVLEKAGYVSHFVSQIKHLIYNMS